MKLAGAYINDDTYGRLVALAAANNRTLAGQCRHLFDRALRGELQVPDDPGTAQQQALGLATAPPWQTASPQTLVAPRQPLRALPRALAALKARRMPGSPLKPLPKAGTGAKPQPVANAMLNPQPMANAMLNPQPMANAMLNPQPVANAMLNPQPVANATLNPQPMAGAVAAMAAAVPHGALRGCENVPVAGMGVVAGMPVGIGILATPVWPATGQSHPAKCAGDAVAGCGVRHDDACFFEPNPMPMPNPNHPRPCLQPTPSPLPHTAPRDAHAPQNAARRMPR